MEKAELAMSIREDRGIVLSKLEVYQLNPVRKETLLKFQEAHGNELKELLGSDKVSNYYDKFWSIKQLEALRILGPESAEFVLNTSIHKTTLCKLKELGPEKCGIHGWFTYYTQMRALWIVGKERAEEALHIRDDTSLDSFLIREMEDPVKKDLLCSRFHEEKYKGFKEHSLLGKLDYDDPIMDHSITEKLIGFCGEGWSLTNILNEMFYFV